MHLEIELVGYLGRRALAQTAKIKMANGRKLEKDMREVIAPDFGAAWLRKAYKLLKNLHVQDRCFEQAGLH